jgi:protein TonB
MKRNLIQLMMTLAGVLTISAAGAMAGDEVRVSQSEAVKAATAKYEPAYPLIAKQLHLEGRVELEAVIDESGSVESVKPLTGNAVLMNSALATMKRWKFRPFTAAGKPVKAVADMSFKFSM